MRSTNPAHWQDLARAPAGRGLRGAPVSRGALYLMLKNRIYRGEIVHKGKALPGEHAAIVDEDLWRRVQSHLEENRIERRGGDKALEPSLLAGIVFDAGSEPMTPTRAVKKGTRYRYYISRRLITGPASDSSRGQRIPASNLEALVISRVRKRRKIGCDKRPCFLLCCLKVFQVFASFCCGKTPPDRTPPFGRRSRSPFSSCATANSKAMVTPIAKAIKEGVKVGSGACRQGRHPRGQPRSRQRRAAQEWLHGLGRRRQAAAVRDDALYRRERWETPDHRPGRAEFPHPVLHERDSLAAAEPGHHYPRPRQSLLRATAATSGVGSVSGADQASAKPERDRRRAANTAEVKASALHSEGLEGADSCLS